MKTANEIILLSGIAQAILTFIVAFVLYFRRISELKRRRINPQDIASSAQSSSIIEDTRASDNFKNLFEVPVLFYFLCAVISFSQSGTDFLALLSVFFVLLRSVHSYIQCTINVVMWRFYVFITSTLVLLIMLAAFTYDFLLKN